MKHKDSQEHISNTSMEKILRKQFLWGSDICKNYLGKMIFPLKFQTVVYLTGKQFYIPRKPT